MYLKALEVQGFKSFPDKTVLNFGEDITAIVGPNGSGKSNISDAIRWVMGEQSSKALRGGKMEDVIFGGTEKRAPVGFAQVTLVLDNTGHLFPSMDESEVAVTRRYYRSGESEYYINRQSVRLKDMTELFMDTGMGREGYSIVGQGRVDEILSTKSTDRREIFEEAAGISKYRHRKEEAERKLERTEENLVRINDKIAELELQVEPLRMQAETAKKYLVLRDEMRLLEISLWLEQLEKIRAGAIKTLSDYENAVRQKEEAQGAVEALYAAAEEHAAQMRDKDVEAEGVRFQMMQREADANGLENAVAVLRANIQNNLENRDRIRRELEQQEGRADSIGAQIAERKERLEALVGELDALAELSAKQGEAEETARSAGTLAGELEELRRKEAVENASASEARALLSALAAAAQELLDRDEAVHQELSAGEERVRQLQEGRDAAQKELAQAREDRDSLQNVLNGYGLRLESRRKKAKEAEERHVKLQMEENALHSRIHMLSEMEKLYEGYSKAVKLVMGEARRGQLKGVHGPVAGLLHVPDHCTVAIETALGGAMQHIVVEREEDGKAAIQYLKRRDGGRSTFLPLSTIRPSDFRDQGVRREAGFVGLGDELVQFDPRYQRIFSNLLGRTVVAEDMDAAIAMARKYGHRFKIVTLDGQVLNPGGSMTGGSASRSAGILSRANELERLNRQRAGVEEQRAAAAQAMEEARREATAAAYEVETAQAQQRQHEDAILKLEERLAHFDAQPTDASRRRDEQRRELEQIQARSAQTEADTAAAGCSEFVVPARRGRAFDI